MQQQQQMQRMGQHQPPRPQMMMPNIQNMTPQQRAFFLNQQRAMQMRQMQQGMMPQYAQMQQRGPRGAPRGGPRGMPRGMPRGPRGIGRGAQMQQQGNSMQGKTGQQSSMGQQLSRNNTNMVQQNQM